MEEIVDNDGGRGQKKNGPSPEKLKESLDTFSAQARNPQMFFPDFSAYVLIVIMGLRTGNR